MVSTLIRQLRPKQWVKNAFLFAAIVFSGQFLNPDSVVRALVAFCAFCMISSTGYILNDILDREADRNHPKKKHRPIASGALPVGVAIAEMVVIFVIGVGLSYWLGGWFLAVALVYLVTTLSYSFYFKHTVILDVMVLSSGFVWRTIAGAVAIKVAVSAWLFLCTMFVALWLGFNKRRSELVKIGANSGTRQSLTQYSPRMLEEFQSIVTSNTVVSYVLYTVLGPTPWMVVTIPMVLYGVFRYIYLVDRDGGGGGAPTEALLGDRPILANVALFAITCIGVMYLHHGGLLTDDPSSLFGAEPGARPRP